MKPCLKNRSQSAPKRQKAQAFYQQPAVATPGFVPNAITAFVMGARMTGQARELGALPVRQNIDCRAVFNTANILAGTAYKSQYEAGQVQATGRYELVECTRCRTAGPYTSCKRARRQDVVLVPWTAPRTAWWWRRWKAATDRKPKGPKKDPKPGKGKGKGKRAGRSAGKGAGNSAASASTVIAAS
ncbi:hypothetical protein DL98DRAFT_589851 [Cadophora sp. DSE1049]|nr:hypothetical protein DL98DRAFT_589851 [Cadophora sp. DSE1049]